MTSGGVQELQLMRCHASGMTGHLVLYFNGEKCEH